MDNLIKLLSDYYRRVDFRKFQNEFAKEIYDTLGKGYSNSDGEVKLVTDICKAINGKSYGRLKFYSSKIHGTRSNVEFNNRNKTTTKELADMVIITVATRGGDIIYEKTAFVQNKKESVSEHWQIDQDQLYLLHNFPTFKGSRGIFKGNYMGDVAFLNHSGNLGNYGFFQSPGEMILANALTVYRLQQGSTISLSDIRRFTDKNASSTSGFQSTFQDFRMLEEMLYYYFKYLPDYRLASMNFPFLNNSSVSFNLYDFIRNWTYFNIGEVASAFGKTIDIGLSNFTRLLLRGSGLANAINLNVEDSILENDFTVLVAHLNLDE